MWFSDYDGQSLGNTPRVYLIPVGSDVLRSPTQAGQVRQFTIMDQVLPAPFPINASDLTDASWIPSVDTTLDFNAIRRYAAFRAYHDTGVFEETQVNRTDSRAIGRAVWNSRWLLVIPAATLLNDRDEALLRFIEGTLSGDGSRDGGISDIKIFFETYATSGV